GDSFPVISKKGQPPLGRVRFPRSPFHPARDGSLGNIKTQHEKFAVNARCAPGCILADHAEDEIPYLLGRLSSPNLPPGLGNQPPIQTKTSAVPAYHCSLGDDDGGIASNWSRLAEPQPKRAGRRRPGSGVNGAVSARQV